MHKKNLVTAGQELASTNRVLIALHGRGGTAEDILSLAKHLDTDDFSLIAPQATGNSWYPYSFLAPPKQNEPWLSSAIDLLHDIVSDIKEKGVPAEKIYFLGFSQGACLSLEFSSRYAQRYGGVIAFTGGLIGDKIYPGRYQGDFAGTPVFIGTSDPDFHVPVERVYATNNIMTNLGASVREKVYPNMGHTIIRNEIDQANEWVLNPKDSHQDLSSSQ